MRITAAFLLALAAQAHAQNVIQIETSTTSDDILVSFDRPTCPGDSDGGVCRIGNVRTGEASRRASGRRAQAPAR